jgi:hypothetical protein
MRVELRELLRSRPICHPSRIVSASIEAGTLWIVMRGYPWWLGTSGHADEQTIVFLLEGLAGGMLRIEDVGDAYRDDDEALETFEAHSLVDLDWAQPSRFAIYCSDALKDPLSLYRRVHDYLDDVDAYRTPGDFLNYPSKRLAQFIQITSSGSYLVGRGPECVRNIICAELETQGVRYNVIESQINPTLGMLIRLGTSDILCASAFAEFDE